MLKHFVICAALVSLGIGSVQAQQREAVLKKIEVPDMTFDLVIATPGTTGVVMDLSESPDALVLHLVGGQLALGFETGEQLLKASDLLQSPVGALLFKSKTSASPIPVAVYAISKGAMLASAEK